MPDLLISTSSGLYCPEGDFYIDPWRPVATAIITHAHSDHAVPGSARYFAAASGVGILHTRIGANAKIHSLEYGERLTFRGVSVSLHPAGHILGSAQVRVERKGEIWVMTGDFKADRDSSCAALEPLQCHTLITESTFGLPIYRWQPGPIVFDEINAWWRATAADGMAAVLFAYSLGKAQRVLSGLDPSIGPLYCHGAIERLNGDYRDAGVGLPATIPTGPPGRKQSWAGAMILAPTSARGSAWLRRFSPFSSGFVSGWMQVRGARRRRAVDRGFALSDHADWPTLLANVRESGAERILVTHGFVHALVRWLRENGWQADALHTEFRGELDESAELREAGGGEGEL